MKQSASNLHRERFASFQFKSGRARPTTINSAEGIFEIPFGTVRRKPYGIRGNARGEWPAHRFVAIKDRTHGISLANTGVGGVEVGGGTLWTTLLRAPKATDVGMKPDDTSSQHGQHTFKFAIIPYAGTWDAAGVIEHAQELNTPIHTILQSGKCSNEGIPNSFFKLDSDHVILSAIKTASDKSGDLIVRVYETAGREDEAVLWVPTAERGWYSDLRERKLEACSVADRKIRLRIKPFEITTIRLANTGICKPY